MLHKKIENIEFQIANKSVVSLLNAKNYEAEAVETLKIYFDNLKAEQCYEIPKDTYKQTFKKLQSWLQEYQKSKASNSSQRLLTGIIQVAIFDQFLQKSL